MSTYYPVASPYTDLTINGTTVRHLYIDDRIWVHNADLAEAIGALAKGCLLSGVSNKWKRKWREDLGGGKATRAFEQQSTRSAPSKRNAEPSTPKRSPPRHMEPTPRTNRRSL